MSDNPIEFSMHTKALCVPMIVAPPAIITRQPVGDVILRGPQDAFYLKVPASEFPFLTPGSQVMVSLTIVKPEFKQGVPDAQLIPTEH